MEGMNWQHHINAAQGYLELGMFQRSWDELEAVEPTDRARFEVLAMRLTVLQHMERWQMGAEIARGAQRRYPEEGMLYLLGSYHIRRSEDLPTAFDFLSAGEKYLENEGCYWFNMACYHCQLGRLDETRECVKRAVELDRKYQLMVLEDEDLRPMWDS